MELKPNNNIELKMCNLNWANKSQNDSNKQLNWSYFVSEISTELDCRNQIQLSYLECLLDD